jgi:hypothetical protein
VRPAPLDDAPDVDPHAGKKYLGKNLPPRAVDVRRRHFGTLSTCVGGPARHEVAAAQKDVVGTGFDRRVGYIGHQAGDSDGTGGLVSVVSSIFTSPLVMSVNTEAPAQNRASMVKWSLFSYQAMVGSRCPAARIMNAD